MRSRVARWFGVAVVAVVAAQVMRGRRAVAPSPERSLVHQSPSLAMAPDPAADPAIGTGQYATRPGEIPARGWFEILRRTGSGIRRNKVPLLSAGVAFYAMLSLVPAMVAIVSVYGLIVTPAQAVRQVDSLTTTLPPEARQLISNQLQRVASSSTRGLSIGLAVGLAGALWGASSGMRWMMTALSSVYDETETRKFLRLRVQALFLTIGAIAALVVSLGMLVGLPALFDEIGLPRPGRVFLDIVRFPVLGLLMIGGLNVLYRVGADRRQPRWRWVNLGSLAAVALWLLGSTGLSLYAANASKFDAAGTYGALGAVIILLLWLYLTVFAVLLGAELNAEAEHQTARDSTVGPDQPRGQREAAMADQVAGWPLIARRRGRRRSAIGLRPRRPATPGATPREALASVGDSSR